MWHCASHVAYRVWRTRGHVTEADEAWVHEMLARHPAMCYEMVNASEADMAVLRALPAPYEDIGPLDSIDYLYSENFIDYDTESNMYILNTTK